MATGGQPRTDPDAERVIDETDVDDTLPDELDASFEDPVPDVIDQRREVALDDDDRD
ncbi:MAG: hypothetical protein HKN44_01915 [Ilumatobacter sp.]|nr:hypothetical protein [Ilumatobacter sp.]